MSPNPYRRVHALGRRRSRRWPVGALALLAAAAATPLARPVLLGFLDTGRIADGTEAIAFRLGALVASAMALHTYADLVRGPDRPVLDPHPVDARLLVTAIALRCARERAYLPAMAAVLLSPIALAGHTSAWLGGSAVVLCAWLSMLGVGFATHLAGVQAGLSPEVARLLDAIRGDTPRTQAALLYAPGVALLAVGVATGLSSSGVGAALAGLETGWAWLAIPLVLGLAGWTATRPLAEGTYVRATALLTEIDGMYAGVQGADTDDGVYLEGFARGRPELLRALRQGWRRLRLWPVGAWVLGLLGLLSAWARTEEAPTRALALTAAAVLLISAVPTQLADGDPPWLDRALALDRWRVARARGAAAWLYCQPAIVLPAAGIAVRHEGALRFVLQTEALAALGAALASALALRWRGRGLWLFGPGGVLLWALAVGRAFA